MPASRVVDASVAVKLFFYEGDPTPVRVALAAAEWRIAPDLLFVEFASVALKKVRQGLISLGQAENAVAAVPALIDEVAPLLELSGPALSLGASHGFSAYDASYLALAQRREGVLLTADAKLERRAAESGFSSYVQFVS